MKWTNNNIVAESLRQFYCWVWFCYFFCIFILHISKAWICWFFCFNGTVLIRNFLSINWTVSCKAWSLIFVLDHSLSYVCKFFINQIIHLLLKFFCHMLCFWSTNITLKEIFVILEKSFVIYLFFYNWSCLYYRVCFWNISWHWSLNFDLCWSFNKINSNRLCSSWREILILHILIPIWSG